MDVDVSVKRLDVPPQYWNTPVAFSDHNRRVTHDKSVFQALIGETFIAENTGRGKDNKHHTVYKNVRVNKVERLENFILWELFCTKRNQFLYPQFLPKTPCHLPYCASSLKWMREKFFISDEINEGTDH